MPKQRFGSVMKWVATLTSLRALNSGPVSIYHSCSVLLLEERWSFLIWPKTSLNGNIQGPVLSLTGLRHPTDYSPEIKARQALFAFLSVYPKEVALVGGNSAGLPGNFLTWPWFPDEHTLWNCGIWRHISALWRKDICRSIPFYWLKGAFFKKLYLEIF